MYSQRPYSLITRKGYRKYINEAEAGRFLSSAKNYRIDKQLFFMSLYYTGARLNEVLNIRVGHVDRSEGCIYIHSLKKRVKGKYRAIPIPKVFMAKLQEYISLLPDSNQDSLLWRWSTRSASYYVRDVMKRAEIEGPQSCARGLRHHFGMRLVMNRINITVIQKLMGHSSILSTQVYLQLDFEEVKKVVNQLWDS